MVDLVILVNNMIKIEDIKPGAIVILSNIKTTKEYTIIDVCARAKFNENWHNIITYKPNYKSEYTIFARTIDDFINYFELKK